MIKHGCFLLAAMLFQACLTSSLPQSKQKGKLMRLIETRTEACSAFGGVCRNATDQEVFGCQPPLGLNNSSPASVCPTNNLCCLELEGTMNPPATCNVNSAGVITRPRGKVKVGSKKNYYKNNQNCQWEILTDVGYTVSIAWKSIDIEGPSPNCPYDAIQIIDGLTGQNISGRLCGTELPPPIVGLSNVTVIKFTTDSSVTGHGFKLRFETVPARLMQPGFIEIGSEEENYGNRVNQQWSIVTAPGMNIIFDWLAFDIEGPRPLCPYDFVEIINTRNGKSLSGRLCGSGLPLSMIFPVNEIRVSFRSDRSVTGRGFKLRYIFSEGESVPTADYFTTPGIDTTTAADTTTGTPTTSGESVPTADYFTTPGINTTTAADTTTGTPTTSEATTTAYQTTTEQENIILGLPAIVEVGSRTSPYENNVDKRWSIYEVPGMFLKVELLAFELEGPSPNCYYDYVQILDMHNGTSLSGRFCGSLSPQTLFFPSSDITIHFHTDGSVVRRGFQVRISSVSDRPTSTDSPGNVTEGSVETTLFFTTIPATNTITQIYTRYSYPSPSHLTTIGQENITSLPAILEAGSETSNYANNVDKRWSIYGVPGMVLKFEWLAFQIEGPSPNCPWDFVEISDMQNGNSLRKLCGSQRPQAMFFTSRDVTVHFHTDGSVVLRGFKLRISSVSGESAPTADNSTTPEIETTTAADTTTRTPTTSALV